MKALRISQKCLEKGKTVRLQEVRISPFFVLCALVLLNLVHFYSYSPHSIFPDDNRNVDETYLTLVNESSTAEDQKCEWRPLLLLVPLRLGLTSINRCYLPAIEVCHLEEFFCFISSFYLFALCDIRIDLHTVNKGSWLAKQNLRAIE